MIAKLEKKIFICVMSLLMVFIVLGSFSGNASMYVHAQTFLERKPSFGLYCDNQSADINGKIKYVIDGEGNAMQYSEYTVNGTSDFDLYIPFLSSLFDYPEIDIAVNGKSVTGEIQYGEVYSLFNEKLNYDFYSTDLNGMTGTIYTLNATSEKFTVSIKMLENQNCICRFTQGSRIIDHSKQFTCTVNDARTDIPYEVFILNGDCSEFESSAQITKETVTVKEYIDRNFDEMKDFFSAFDNASPDLLYALINNALDKSINYDYFDFFFDSFSRQRIDAYKVNAKAYDLPCTVSYSMPVYVQNNSAFKPKIYMTEQTATGNYNIDYTIELNSELPYIIESSTELKNQNNYTYTSQNVNEDFYFVFSASKNPQSIYDNNNGMETWRIILLVLSGVFGCALIVFLTMLIISFIKNKKQRKGNE